MESASNVTLYESPGNRMGWLKSDVRQVKTGEFDVRRPLFPCGTADGGQISVHSTARGV